MRRNWSERMLATLLAAFLSIGQARGEDYEVMDVVTGAIATNRPPAPLKSFFVGYNEAWFGEDWGRDLTSNFDPVRVNQIFRSIKQHGGAVVRIFLFEGAQGFILQDSAPRLIDLQQGVLANVDFVFQAAAKNGLYIYLTLFDANTPPGPGEPSKYGSPLLDGNYYYNLYNARYGELDAYNNLVLGPVLKRLEKYKQNVYGVDIVNEIHAAILKKYWSNTWDGPRAWIKTEVQYIKNVAPWVKVTSSTYDAPTFIQGLYSGLGLDFYAFHAYSDWGDIPSVGGLCNRAAVDGIPIILGEYGQRSHNEDDELQRSATAAFLQNASGACFKGALAWRFDAAEQWLHLVRSDGTPRPAVSIIEQYANRP